MPLGLQSDGPVERQPKRQHSDALIIVDLQPDFMPGGALAVPDGDAVVAPIAALLARTSRGKNPFHTIVATQDWHPPGHISFASQYGRPPFSQISLYGKEQTLWPDHCVCDTPGAALHKDLPLTAMHLILRKGTSPDVDSYSAFRENFGPDQKRKSTGLAALLKARGVSRLFVCGLALDFCVAWTALDAVAEGFAVVVLDDLCRAVYPDRQAGTSAAFDAAGIQHIPSSMLASLLADADADADAEQAQ